MTRGDTRQRILDAALTLFAERGYAGTSIRDIAEELEVTKAAVHYHFPSKEQMLPALLEPFLGTFERVLDAHAPGPVDGAVLLRDLQEVLDDMSPLLGVLSSDPSAAGSCSDLHDQAKQMGHRMALVLVGQDAPRAQVLRAHVCMGGFFAGYQQVRRDRGPDSDLDDVRGAALAALGQG